MLREALWFGHQALKAPKGTEGGLHRAGGRIWELLTSIIEESLQRAMEQNWC